MEDMEDMEDTEDMEDMENTEDMNNGMPLYIDLYCLPCCEVSLIYILPSFERTQLI